MQSSKYNQTPSLPVNFLEDSKADITQELFRLQRRGQLGSLHYLGEKQVVQSSYSQFLWPENKKN